MNIQEQSEPKKRSIGFAMLLAFVAIAAAVMIYGIFTYPNAPIKFRKGAYRDKAGMEYSEAEFHRFILWKRCLLGSFALVAVSSIPLAFSKRKQDPR